MKIKSHKTSLAERQQHGIVFLCLHIALFFVCWLLGQHWNHLYMTFATLSIIEILLIVQIMITRYFDRNNNVVKFHFITDARSMFQTGRYQKTHSTKREQKKSCLGNNLMYILSSSSMTIAATASSLSSFLIHQNMTWTVPLGILVTTLYEPQTIKTDANSLRAIIGLFLSVLIGREDLSVALTRHVFLSGLQSQMP